MKRKSMESSSSRKPGLDNEDGNAANVGKKKRICGHIGDEERKCQTYDGQGNPWKKKCLKLEAHLFKNNSTSRGGQVKEAAEVLMLRSKNCSRKSIQVNCRVEAFGKICKCFDDRRKRWVSEMGFGGLLYLVGMRLPRNLCYWLMSRVDPINKLLIAPDGHEYILSKDHVSWILGIPNGNKVVPRKVITEEMRGKVRDIRRKYGRVWESMSKKNGKPTKQKAIYMSPAVMERAKGSWAEEDEEEFKTLFLMLALVMVLCPTLGNHLESGLVPALTCALRANKYDWCGLVLEKLMLSIQRFATKFYADGYSFGCGGCSIFLAIFYLDRLDRDPVAWGKWPRITAWTAKEMMKARDEDQIAPDKDFGNLHCLDVSYGDRHPWEAWDMDFHASLADKELDPRFVIPIVRGKRKLRRRPLKRVMLSEELLLEKDLREGTLQSGVPDDLPQATEVLAISSIMDAVPMAVYGGPKTSNSNCENILLDDKRIIVGEEQNIYLGIKDGGNDESRLPSPSRNEMRIARLNDIDGQPDLNNEGSPCSLASMCHGSVPLSLMPTSEEMHTEITPCDKRVSLTTTYIKNCTRTSSDCRKEVDENAEENIGSPPMCLTSPFNATVFLDLSPGVGEMHTEKTTSCDKITITPSITVGKFESLSSRISSSDKISSLRKYNEDNEMRTSQRSDVSVKETVSKVDSLRGRVETFKESCEIVDLCGSDDDNDDSNLDPLEVLGYYDLVARISKLEQELPVMKALKKRFKAI